MVASDAPDLIACAACRHTVTRALTLDPDVFFGRLEVMEHCSDAPGLNHHKNKGAESFAGRHCVPLCSTLCAAPVRPGAAHWTTLCRVAPLCHYDATGPGAAAVDHP